MRKFAFLLAGALGVALVACGSGQEASFQETLAQGLLATLLVAFGKGVLTSLTPCVYPMIPITLAVFGARDAQSRVRSFLLALAYVEGMAVFYTVVGTPFALNGKIAGSLLSNPWVVVPIAGILAAMGASFLGAFNLNLPASVQARLSTVGGRGFRGAFQMGLVAGPIAAPCTGPFLIDMISHVAKTGDPVLAALILFTYAHGIGVLFFVLAVSASSLPKSGAWMDGVKSFCAILLFVGAVYFLQPVLPALKYAQPTREFLLGSLGVAVMGLAIGAVHLNFAYTSWPTKVRKAVGMVLATLGLVGVVNWYFKPARDIGWRHDEQIAFKEAKDYRLLVIVDFGASWCAPCKEIEKIMAKESVFAEMTRDFVPLKFDVSEQNERDEALQKKYHAGELPAVIFLDQNGREIGRYNDKAPAEDSFVKTLREVVKNRSP